MQDCADACFKTSQWLPICMSQKSKGSFLTTKLHVIGLPRWLSGKESSCNAVDAGDDGLIPGLERSPGEGHGNLLQYFCLEKNLMDRGAWKATVHGV